MENQYLKLETGGKYNGVVYSSNDILPNINVGVSPKIATLSHGALADC